MRKAQTSRVLSRSLNTLLFFVCAVAKICVVAYSKDCKDWLKKGCCLCKKVSQALLFFARSHLHPHHWIRCFALITKDPDLLASFLMKEWD